MKSRRSAATAARKKKVAMRKDVIPDDLKVLDVVENVKNLLEGALLKVQLLCPKKKPITPVLKRYIVRVVDSRTFMVAETAINSREMQNFGSELRRYFPGIDMDKVFKPTSDAWWKANYMSALTANISGSEMVIRLSKRLIRNVVGKSIEELGLQPMLLPPSPDAAGGAATVTRASKPSEAKWGFHTEDDMLGDTRRESFEPSVESTVETTVEPTPESAPVACVEGTVEASDEPSPETTGESNLDNADGASDEKKIEEDEKQGTAREEGFLEVRKISLGGLPEFGMYVCMYMYLWV